MSKIFELFGYRLDAWGNEAEENLQRAWCPFIGAKCDGGGNRYSSAIDLGTHPELAERFQGLDERIIPAGVCSLLIRDRQQPWIICPRRLFALRGNPSNGSGQAYVRQQLAKRMDLLPRQNYRAWSEVKMKVGTTTDDEQEKSFDYTFDYVIAGSKRILLADAAELIGCTEKKARNHAENNGFTLAKRGDIWIEDFPADPIIIVEVMTSSTSGGDKKKRTQISMAFEDAILNPASHNAPGINYRQVWARMVSQLIVKSQVGMAWNGKTIWLIQDVLADYISSSTALNLSRYLAEHSDEVNILAFGYGRGIYEKPNTDAITPLETSRFYAGPIESDATPNNQRGGFIEIVKIGAPPPKNLLWRSLFLKSPCATLTG